MSQLAARFVSFLPLILVWTAMSCALAWYLGRLMQTVEDEQKRGQRALDIADGWLALAAMSGVDGEAWTYEQAARHWERVAHSHGVVRPLRAHRSEAPRLPSLPGKHAYEE